SGNPITSLPEGINSGVYITEVGVDSISNGILFADDIIVSFNGEKIMYSYEFRAILGEMTKGDSAEFLVYRGNEFIEVIITFE
ncbi:MAG: PDZ domain-containing protein, partial [Bacilli bacterium]